jgi:hypothetical protein
MSIVTVRAAFEAASGLAVRHVALGYAGSAQTLEFDGIDSNGRPFNISSGPTNEDPHQAAHRLGLLQKHKILDKLETEINFGQPMTSKAKTISERIAHAKHSLASDLDAIGHQLDAYDAKKPEVLARVHSTVTGLHSEVDGLDADLKILSNSE